MMILYLKSMLNVSFDPGDYFVWLMVSLKFEVVCCFVAYVLRRHVLMFLLVFAVHN